MTVGSHCISEGHVVNAKGVLCITGYLKRCKKGNAAKGENAKPMQWVSNIHMYAPLQYAKVVRHPNGRVEKSECTTVVAIQGEQDWQDRSRDK